MIIFDSGPILAYINPKDPNHEIALKIFTDSLQGNYGKMIISSYIVDEVLTLSRARTKSCKYGKAILELLELEKDKKKVFLEIFLDKDMIQETKIQYEKFCEKGLSFTDCSLLALIKIFEIEYLVSFAKEFDGLVSKIP
ncbi:MAG: tRNA(fMet)-specific endonuclease VapC [Candidatus Heimdallarchaeota archaeon LC_3]|nr:MAG: tRNA(fMet)-specific endonuclease VapC [Candidatus Heimdallarchaeota archaeon LC_3]